MIHYQEHLIFVIFYMMETALKKGDSKRPNNEYALSLPHCKNLGSVLWNIVKHIFSCGHTFVMFRKQIDVISKRHNIEVHCKR